MRMKIWQVLWRALGILVVGCGCNAEGAPKTETNFFPIMAWNSAPNDPAVLKKMHDCGLTVAGFVAPNVLDACQKAGLKGIVSDPRVGGYDWTKVDASGARSN